MLEFEVEQAVAVELAVYDEDHDAERKTHRPRSKCNQLPFGTSQTSRTRRVTRMLRDPRALVVVY